MSDTPTTTNRPARDPLENPLGRSAMFDKLPPDLRRTVDQAIVDRDPSTFRGLYDKFHLADSGVSYYAFYRYARKLRARADRLHLAELVLPDDTDLADAMPRLIAQQLLETLLSDEAASPEVVLRLTRAYRLATQTYIAQRRFAVQLEDDERNARIKETDGFLKAANQIAQCQANENWMQGHIANSIRAALQPGPDAHVAARAPARPPSAAPPRSEPERNNILHQSAAIQRQASMTAGLSAIATLRARAKHGYNTLNGNGRVHRQLRSKAGSLMQNVGKRGARTPARMTPMLPHSPPPPKQSRRVSRRLRSPPAPGGLRCEKSRPSEENRPLLCLRKHSPHTGNLRPCPPFAGRCLPTTPPSPRPRPRARTCAPSILQSIR